MISSKKVAVFIGRFQMPHVGHFSIIEKIKDDFDHVVILVGSANRRISVKNMFSAEERIDMIESILNKQFPNLRYSIQPNNDTFYKETKWETQVYYQVHDILEDEFDGEIEDSQISIVGYEKDNSSYYLHSFPQWNVVLVDQKVKISSTDLRNQFFESLINKDEESKWQEMSSLYIPKLIANRIESLRTNQDNEKLNDLIEEYQFYIEEKQKFANYPYLEHLRFSCADTVVICKGHVLMVKRKFAPGKNTWALPGGFVQSNETFAQAALRELKEETSIKVPERALEERIKVASKSALTSKLFDDVNRTLGIPRHTMAYYIEVDADHKGKLPKIKAADDALEAAWIPISKANKMKLFDDHSDIVDYFTGSV